MTGNARRMTMTEQDEEFFDGFFKVLGLFAVLGWLWIIVVMAF